MQYFQDHYIKNKSGEIKLKVVWQIVCVNLKLKMFMKSSTSIKNYLTSVISKKIQNITIMQIT